jgi:uncharacterized protein YndB with AHSA1/START domain
VKENPSPTIPVFIKEYELRTTPRLLYPYIATAEGLSQWFADRFTKALTPESSFILYWDKQAWPCKIISAKALKVVRIEIQLPNLQDLSLSEPLEQLASSAELEMTIVPDTYSQGVFLRIADSTLNEEEPGEVWDHLVAKLRERIGA